MITKASGAESERSSSTYWVIMLTGNRIGMTETRLRKGLLRSSKKEMPFTCESSAEENSSSAVS